MSKDILVLNTEKISLLNGTIITGESNSISIPVYVVIVDDNSGSMSGSRAKFCADKTKTIIRECITKGIKYQYAT